MTPAARVQSAIVLLDQIIAAATAGAAPADRILSDWFRANRFAGSKDRRAIRELVYRAIRACGPVPRTGRAAMLRLVELDETLAPLFDGTPYGPPRIGRSEKPALGGIAPEWLTEMLYIAELSEEEMESLIGRAPLDIRVNGLKADRASLELPVAGEHLPNAQGIRLEAGTQVDQWDAYKDGLIEVQDAGSQMACDAVAARPGETVIDLCAGAGGKTLALAAAMENQGTLIASDTDKRRLSQLAPRAERAGAFVAETVLLNPGKELDALKPWQRQADAVLVDAPCSGSGTWRRNPEARWRMDADSYERLLALQARLLDVAATLVKPGGRLIYVTCSVMDEEGADQIARFLGTNPGWRAQLPKLPLGTQRGEGLRLTPHSDGTDGFFIAHLVKA